MYTQYEEESAKSVLETRKKFNLSTNDLYADGVIYASCSDPYVEHLFENRGYSRWSKDEPDDYLRIFY